MYTVFLVDDEPLALEGLKNGIAWVENGFELVGSSTSATAACQQILELRPQVVFTDIRMPEMDGVQLIEALKQQGLTAEFVIVSAVDDYNTVRRVLQLQGFDYLRKPASQETFQELLLRLSERLRVRFPYSVAVQKTASHELNAILDYVSDNLGKKHALPELGKRFSMSPNYICSLFSKHMNTTFVNHLVQMRMERADKLLMGTDKAVKEIALLCGYDDYFYFCKVFRNYYSCTPTQRRQQQGEAKG